MEISFNYISTNRRALLCCPGGFLLCFSQSLDYSYPNLNTYITSYCRKNGFETGRGKSDGLSLFISRHNPGLTYGDFIFVTAAKNLMAAQIAHEPLVRKETRMAFFERATLTVVPTKKVCP